MSDQSQSFTKTGFAKAFVVPALMIFPVPIIGLFFFLHAQSTYDDSAREGMISAIAADPQMTPQEKADAIKFYETVPFSKLMEVEEFARQIDKDTRFYYATFRWMIRVSAWSIASSIAVFVLTGLAVVASLKSHFIQYVSLTLSWHILRIYSALLTVAQGVLVVALSFWVTALWFEIYIMKLIFLAGLLAVIAVGVVIKGIFTRPDTGFSINGTVITSDDQPRLWGELQSICDVVGTSPPDQVIVGIDDNFFVTEQRVEVNGTKVRGRTLYVSLSLLKQLDRVEADAVLAHEMAHFSGNDTLYSKRISPQLIRYASYLAALEEGGITLPIFYFMLCFRMMFELSLNKLSRAREYRADRIASEVTSPQAVAGALLRIIAYSEYRNSVQNELFSQDEALEVVNIAERIEDGFHDYQSTFLSRADVWDLTSSHPFDSHPALADRLESVGVQPDSVETRRFLDHSGDGLWVRHIANGVETERQQWTEFEDEFRKFHLETLPWRFIPETEEEREIVVEAFPEVRFEGKDGEVIVDYEQVDCVGWSEPVLFSEIRSLHIDDDGVLHVTYQRDGNAQVEKIKGKRFAKEWPQIVEAIGRYHGRCEAATEYQNQKVASEDETQSSDHWDQSDQP